MEDAYILRTLDELRESFESGDASKLLQAVFRCAYYQAVMPDWAADALLQIETDLNSGRLRDLSAAFEKPSDVRARAKRVRQELLTPKVLAELMHHRIGNPECPNNKGGNFSAGDGLQAVASKLKVGLRDVIEIYQKHGDGIRSIPQGGGGVGHAVSYSKIEPLIDRRRGRPILADTSITPVVIKKKD